MLPEARKRSLGNQVCLCGRGEKLRQTRQAGGTGKVGGAAGVGGAGRAFSARRTERKTGAGQWGR